MKVTLNTNNYINQNKSSAARPMFKGNVYTSLTDSMAKGFGHFAKKPGTVKFIDEIAKKDVVSTLAATTGVVISGFYMYNTAKSKKIEPEQKKPLIINMGLVTAISTIVAKCIDSSVKKKIAQFEKFFEARNAAKMSKSTLDACKKGIGPAATLLIFTTVYRYLSPVIATPLANKISNATNAKNNAKKSA